MWSNRLILKIKNFIEIQLPVCNEQEFIQLH